MDEQKQRLAARRGAMVAGGFWRDETLLDHLARAVARGDEARLVRARIFAHQHRDVAVVQRDRVDAQLNLAPLRLCLRFVVETQMVDAFEVVEAPGFHGSVSVCCDWGDGAPASQSSSSALISRG